ncbi:hypothetical protein J6590_073145 [Homalodisca vitripennis]|nr:hypothetical protein J6590_073145 [Homalodisca vitripennis]
MPPESSLFTKNVLKNVLQHIANVKFNSTFLSPNAASDIYCWYRLEYWNLKYTSP